MSGRMLDVIVGRNVLAAMERAQVSQPRLAALIHMARPALSHRLNGRTGWQLADLVAIAAGLDVPLADLVRGLDEPRPGGAR